MKKQLFIFLVLLFAPLYSHAASYSISPLIIDLDLEKRDIVRKEITITNHDGRQIRVYPSVNEVNLDDDGTIESFVEPSMVDDRASSITSWIQISRGRVVIPPGESVTVPVTFKIHPEAKAGNYHAIIGFGSGSNQPEAQQKAMAGVAPVTAVTINIDKVQNQFLRLEKFTVERLVTNNSEGSISYVLHNPGSDPVVPAGEIIFYDNNGTEVFSQPVNSAQETVEPGDELAIVDEAPKDLKMGKYKAFLSVEYGEHLTASVHDTAFFYVLPLTQVLIIFGVIMILSIAIALYVHRRYDVAEEYEDAMMADVPLYIRTDRSQGKDHDIDLSKKE